MAAEQAGPTDGAPHANGAAQANGAAAPSAKGTSGFSLSFSAASTARRRGLAPARGAVQPVDDEGRRELVAGFAGGRLEAVDAAAPVQAGKRVIPRLENTFRVTSSSGPRKFDPTRCGQRE